MHTRLGVEETTDRTTWTVSFMTGLSSNAVRIFSIFEDLVSLMSKSLMAVITLMGISLYLGTSQFLMRDRVS